MGLDFFQCDSQGCGVTICDAGPYFYCPTCGNNLCDGCARKYKTGSYSEEELEIDEDGYEYEDDRGCPFCNVEEVSDSTLFRFALEGLGLSKEELIERYKELHN